MGAAGCRYRGGVSTYRGPVEIPLPDGSTITGTAALTSRQSSTGRGSYSGTIVLGTADPATHNAIRAASGGVPIRLSNGRTDAVVVTNAARPGQPLNVAGAGGTVPF